jgi:ABC-2 type transport system permease protein
MNWSQFRTILWLRWRLTANVVQRSGTLGTVLSVLMVIVGLSIAVGGCVSGLFFGALVAAKQPADTILFIWDGLTLGFLFIWAVGLMTELQRSESIDLQRLMHLPVSLRQVFVFNYLASHVSLSLIIALPTMLGLAVGLGLGRGPGMLFLAPLALSFIFMITAWTYCLRGWLATLMANKRRRRTIIVTMAMAMVLLGQLPNLYFNLARRHDPPQPLSGAKPEEVRAASEERRAASERLRSRFVAAHKFVPFLWLPDGAKRLAAGKPLPVALEFAGCALLGVLGLRRAYRTTLRYYYGETDARRSPASAAGPAPAAAPVPVRISRFLEARPRGVPEQAAALGLATIRSLSRAPEVKMALGVPLVMAVVLSVVFFGRTGPNLPEVAKPFIATSVIGFVSYFLFQFYGNQFGYDRDGFRALVLTPADRRWILFGKNLATAPLTFGAGLIVLTIVGVLLRLPLLVLLASLFQLLTMLCVLSIAGDYLSIVAPYRIQAGSMKASKMPAKIILLMMLGTILMPFFLLPIYLSPLAELLWRLCEGPAFVPVNLLSSIAIAGVSLLVYRVALNPLGRLLQSREIDVLNTVTAELE